MTNALSAAANAYREYRALTKQSRTYRVVRYLIASAALAFFLLLSFPQVLFAYQASHNNLTVYSREPLDPKIHAVLEQVEAKLAKSEISNPNIKPRIFISNSHGMYAIFSLFVGTNSFAKGYPILPTKNVFVNKSDVARDVVFRNSQTDSERSLSGVIAHEVTHFLIREKFGYIKNVTMPAWKKEGYCEYVAGGPLLDYERGVQKWKQSPANDTGYRYFKYYMLVKYLIEIKKMSVEEMFTRDFDVASLEHEVLSTL
jgi:hypothetical protein